MKRGILLASMLVAVSVLLFASCDDGQYALRNISEYKIKKNSLENHATVRVVYSAGGPFKKDAEQASGYQYIVVEVATGDTFRIISNQLWGVNSQKEMTYISYFSQDSSDFIPLMADGMSDDGTMENMVIDGEGKVNIKRPQVTMPGRVYSNNEHQDLESRPFPTVFGMLSAVYR